MDPIKKKNLHEPVILTKRLDNGQLVVVDSKTTVRYLSIDKLEVLNGFKANINHLRFKSDVVAFSGDGKHFATLTSDCKESRLYNAKTKKVVAKVDRHHGEASTVAIEPYSRYMFSGGDDGKIFAVEIRSGKLAFTLPSHVDTINDMAFSKNGNWIAYASYDKKISIFNLSMMTLKHKLKQHSSAVMKVRFLSQNRLLSIDKKSSAFIWNMYSGKLLHRLQGVHDDVTQVVITPDSKFLFLGTALGYILVYDLDTYELLSKKYIKVSSSITALEFYDEEHQLIIGCENGDLLFYNIYEGEDHLKELLKFKKYEEIQKQAENNPLLAYTKVYDLVANLWDKTLEKAKLLLQNNDRKTAQALLEDFKTIPAKNKIIQKVLREYEDFDKFVTYAKEGKLALAYSLANTHPLYKESKIYKSLEAKWQKVFTAAQKYALDPKGTDKAKEILAPYRGISEKTKLIQEVLTKGDVYKRFRVALGQQDFKIAFELIRLHPFLTEFPEYDSLMNYADSLYMKSQEAIQKGDTHTAVKLLRILEDFPDFQEEVKMLMQEIEAKQKFFNAVQSKDYALAYNLMAISEDLQETVDGAKLHKRWMDDLSEAYSYTHLGDVEKIKQLIKPYLKIRSKYMALASLFGQTYIAQLENAIRDEEEQSKIENGIRNYLLAFGEDEHIDSLFSYFKQQYKETKLELERLPKGSLKMWRPSMIVDSIF